MHAILLRQSFNPAIYRPVSPILDKNDFKSIAIEILSVDPKAIGFSTWCHSYPASLLLAQIIREINSEVNLIFGGPQASVLDRQTMQSYPCIDYILRGEAENSLPELMNVILNKDLQKSLTDIEGLTYRDVANGNRIKANPDVRIIEDLDDLPVPNYELIEDKKSLMIEAGRGCPFQCTYCSTCLFFSKSFLSFKDR